MVYNGGNYRHMVPTGIIALGGTSDMKIEQHVFMLGGENIFSW